MGNSETAASNIVATEKSELLANMLMNMDMDFVVNGKDTRKLYKELSMAKTVLHNHLIHTNGDNSIDVSFFVGTVKLINRVEREYERLGIQKRDFLVFLRLILKRFSSQKLLVEKIAEKKAEFKKHKGVVEDEYYPV